MIRLLTRIPLERSNYIKKGCEESIIMIIESIRRYFLARAVPIHISPSKESLFGEGSFS